MQVTRRLRASKSFGIASALLLSTAIAAPAFGQIEEVVVTAQKKTEDIQTVPIAISAYTSQDLKAHQIDRFQDLQFSTPNVSYTKGNFTDSDFQIRGIGVTAIGYDSESGVAINFNDVYLANPNLADSGFYDLQRIEVLRGPQSTLYGRGATGGVVSVVAAKPELDSFGTDLEATYGNYDYMEVKGMVNVPIVTDKLGLRIAGDWIHHSGFTTNVYDNSHPDDRSQYSVRSSLRWQPNEKTTVDLTAQFSNENDRKMRSQKQLCHTDPSAILGCLPDASTPGGLVNPNSNSSNIGSSVQSMQALFGPSLTATFEGLGVPAPIAHAMGLGYSGALGLFDLTSPWTPPSGNPTDPRQINTTFNPRYKAQDNLLSLEWKQSWTSWLDSTVVAGYDREFVWSQESYNNVPGTTIDPMRLAVAEGTFNALIAGGGPAYVAAYAPYFSVPGSLPQSNFSNLGVIGGDYTYTNSGAAFDQSNGSSTQTSGEIRFNTKFNGPFNAMLAGYYMQYHYQGDYLISAPTLDYPAIIVGGLAGMGVPFCSTGCVYGPSYYHNDGNYDSLISKSIYGEVYYDAIPDTLKFTLGARWTEDHKFQRGRIAFFSGLVPIGTTNEDAAMAQLVSYGLVNFDASKPGANVWQLNQVTYDKWTGRAVADWTPKLDFTDATLVYASYARGYKAGGFNPGLQPGLGIDPQYKPELIDAYELGTKNTLLDGTVQANGDVWYYNYTGLQVSKIVQNTSVNENINAKLYGVEGEFIWAPDEHWQFNLNYSNTHTDIGNSSSINPRSPTNGASNALLVKDGVFSSTVAQNCVLYYNGAAPGSLPAGFYAPPGGVGALNGVGIPYAAFGTCSAPTTDMHTLDPTDFPVAGAVNYGQFLAAQGFSTTDPTGKGVYGGVPVNLKGHWLQNTPENTLSIGVQYTEPLENNYRLVGRVDYYWQSDMFGTIFNTSADKISSWDVMNMQLTLSAPDDTWYATAFVKNVMDNNNLTGMYVTAATSGLYTNGFYGDPRTYGITLGVHL